MNTGPIISIRLSSTLIGLLVLIAPGLGSCGGGEETGSSSSSYISIEGVNGGLNRIVSGIQYDVDDTISFLHTSESNSIEGRSDRTTLNGLTLVISEGKITLGEHTFEGVESGFGDISFIGVD